jgi:hypothetical protein
LAEHRELGLNAAWYTFLPDQVLKTAAWHFFESFKKKDMRAWYEFLEANPDTPFSGGKALPWDATGMSELTKLEARYFSKRKRRS